MPDYTRELAAGGRVAGIDEAGRGPLAGPVVAAAVILPPDAPARLDGLDDSKALPRPRRERLFDRIVACAEVGVGQASVEEIDCLNVLAATMLAMRRAFDALAVAADHALVDGNRLPDLPCPGEAVIGGDAACLSIAAASVVAKVTRDRLMCDLARAFPVYGWDTNAGYGTRAHLAALAEHGPCLHHRRSFAPVAQLVMPFSIPS